MNCLHQLGPWGKVLDVARNLKKLGEVFTALIPLLVLALDRPPLMLQQLELILLLHQLLTQLRESHSLQPIPLPPSGRKVEQPRRSAWERQLLDRPR